MKIFHKTCAEIDLSALADNYRKIENHIRSASGKNCKMLCIVKADAYGHGAVKCAETFLECGAEYFGVANIQEALQLREHFKTPEILILGYTEPDLAPIIIENNLTQTIYSDEYADELCAYIPEGKKLTAHLKLDTGMNRLGFSTDICGGLEKAVKICKNKKFDFKGIFTHFACSDEADKTFTSDQLNSYNSAVKYLSDHGIDFEIRHACNSAAALDYPDAHFDLVRCGIILYGLNPSETVTDIGLTPVMTLKTAVSNIHTAKKGESVSYGATFKAERDTKIATLPIGYADGFIRDYSPGGTVLIENKEFPIIGRICMDQCMVDITDYSNGDKINIGDEVVIFGKDKSVNKFSALANTINYETLCLISARVPRIYIK